MAAPDGILSLGESRGSLVADVSRFARRGDATV